MDARLEYVKPDAATAERLAYELYTVYTPQPDFQHYLTEQWFWMAEAYRGFYKAHLYHVNQRGHRCKQNR